MSWLRSNRRWAALNLVATAVLSLILSRGRGEWNASHTFDPGLESGKWAIRFLLICLVMTPLKTYFGWSGAIKLRKPAGLWSFGFALLHGLFYIGDTGLTGLAWPLPRFMALGLGGLVILTALALTSNRWAMRRLKKNWKRLHRLVYLAGLSVVFHALLAAAASKKLWVRDPQAVDELNLYLALLVVLLGVRLPLVRRGLKQIRRWRQARRQADLPVRPIIIHPPAFRPKVNGRAADVPSDDVLAEPQPEAAAERLPIP